MKYIFAAVLIVISCAGCAPTQQGAVAPVVSTTAVAPATTVASVTTPNETASTNKIKLTVIKVDSEETESENGRGSNAVDGNPDTFWHTQWTDNAPECPHEIIIQLSPAAMIKGFTYLPRQDDSENGTIREYEFYVSNDGKDFGKPVKKGEFATGSNKKTVTFDAVKCGFIKLRALSEVNDGAWTSAAEIGVVSAE